MVRKEALAIALMAQPLLDFIAFKYFRDFLTRLDMHFDDPLSVDTESVRQAVRERVARATGGPDGDDLRRRCGMFLKWRGFPAASRPRPRSRSPTDSAPPRQDLAEELAVAREHFVDYMEDLELTQHSPRSVRLRTVAAVCEDRLSCMHELCSAPETSVWQTPSREAVAGWGALLERHRLFLAWRDMLGAAEDLDAADGPSQWSGDAVAGAYASDSRSSCRPSRKRAASPCPENAHCPKFSKRHAGVSEARKREYLFLYAAHARCLTCLEFLASQSDFNVACKSAGKSAREWAVSKPNSAVLDDELDAFLCRHGL